MYIINQKNYFTYLDEINLNISNYKRFLPKLKEYLKKDFPKSYLETLKINFPNIYENFLSNNYNVKRNGFIKHNGKLSTKLIKDNKKVKYVKKVFPSKSIDESFYRAAYNIKKVPKCINCNNNDVQFDSKNCQYHYFCSLKCKIKYESLIQKIDNKEYSFQNYSLAVRKLTEERCNKISNIHLRGNNYHLDHKVSIYKAFKEKLSVDIAASIHNLEIISSNVNLAKGIRCSISVNELIKLHCSSIT
jgi:hypothetical protein